MAPSGMEPVSRNLQRSMSRRRETATMPMALMRRPPWAKRRSNQRVSSESGWKRIQPQAIWMAMARTEEEPALEMPWSRASSPLW